ncbi:MAG: GTPase HflX [Candidatus Marinimicrobia bacterium]|nr:GTPase HflX [Candidatus Neomarinimicrobiota bacterium]MDD5583329.1 GTPase HflX [Candidatus Neomarinimicrobiota bacterium]
MSELLMNQDACERVLLVAIELPGEREKTERSVKELAQLTETAGGDVIDQIIQARSTTQDIFYLGRGKLETLKNLCEELSIETVIFDDELSPGQLKAIHKILGENIKVLDRSALILDIFQQHARTREAKTQVALARAEYMLPRLTRQWVHLERQAGGIGGARRGPGETQIEIDRRLLREQIKKLKKDLEKIALQRNTQRKARHEFFNVALVGYTNAGKSTLMNTLTHATVAVEDKLFKTLDTTVRKMTMPNGREIFLSDTVGFIQKLPHQLVASFRSTLQEAESADLLIKLIDISDPDFRRHLTTIDHVLKDFQIPDKRFLTVFNKADIIPDSMNVALIKREFPDAIWISAREEIGLTRLIDHIQKKMDESSLIRSIAVPHTAGEIIAALHQYTHVLSQSYEDEVTFFTLQVDKDIWEYLLKKYNLDEKL